LVIMPRLCGEGCKGENTARRSRNQKELNHGWQGFHGLGIGLDSEIFIREIREIRGRILAKMSDSDA